MGLGKKGGAKLSVYRLQANPTKPACNPSGKGCLICSAKREDVLGMELMQMKPLFSPVPRRARQSSGVPTTAPPSLGTSWPLISLLKARVSPAWHPVDLVPDNWRKLSCPQPWCLAEDQKTTPLPADTSGHPTKIIPDLHLPLRVSYSAVVPGVWRTSGHFRHCTLFPCCPRS